MLFNSIEFLFLFLPTVLAVFLLLQRAHRDSLAIAWLTLSSLFFFGWWNPVYLLLILASIGINYSLGRQLAVRSGRMAHGLLVAGVCFNLGLLGYFKYFNFFISSINSALGSDFQFETIILPLAISFYTFQQITYLVDSRKGLTESHSLLDYSLFVTFFPQLIAGPIVHHSEMLAQFHQSKPGHAVSRNLAVGGSILAIGLFKKVVVADSFALFANPVYSLVGAGEVLNSLDILAGIFAYAFQLYFDFSGYSDMAIGLATMFGIRLPVNFHSPYKAASIIDFWHRWHVTLSRFLREYLYIPLGGNRKGTTRRFSNILLTMLLGGLWHGASWTFVAWGFLHGTFIVANHLWRKLVARSHLDALRYSYSWKIPAHLLTFSCVVLAWVLFRSDTLSTAIAVLEQLANVDGLSLSLQYQQQLQNTNVVRIAQLLLTPLATTAVVYGWLLLALLCCWCLPNTGQLFERQQVTLDSRPVCEPSLLRVQWQANWRWALFSASLLLASFLNLTQVTEFLYFQF